MGTVRVVPERSGQVVVAGPWRQEGVAVRAPLASDTRDLRRSVGTTKIRLTTEGIFLDSRLCDMCHLEFVSDSLKRELSENKAIQEKPGETSLWQHVLNRESVHWLR